MSANSTPDLASEAQYYSDAEEQGEVARHPQATPGLAIPMIIISDDEDQDGHAVQDRSRSRDAFSSPDLHDGQNSRPLQVMSPIRDNTPRSTTSTSSRTFSSGRRAPRERTPRTPRETIPRPPQSELSMRRDHEQLVGMMDRLASSVARSVSTVDERARALQQQCETAQQRLERLPQPTVHPDISPEQRLRQELRAAQNELQIHQQQSAASQTIPSQRQALLVEIQTQLAQTQQRTEMETQQMTQNYEQMTVQL